MKQRRLDTQSIIGLFECLFLLQQ